MYIAVGVVGALAYHIVDGDDVLTLISISPLSLQITKVWIQRLKRERESARAMRARCQHAVCSANACRHAAVL